MLPENQQQARSSRRRHAFPRKAYLAAIDGTVSDAEECGLNRVSWDLELSKDGSVAIQSLAHLLLN